MSRTLNLTCRQCKQTLWVGQFRHAQDDCYLYGPDHERTKLQRFVNDHIGHDVRFEDSECVPSEFNHMEDDWDPVGGSRILIGYRPN